LPGLPKANWGGIGLPGWKLSLRSCMEKSPVMRWKTSQLGRRQDDASQRLPLSGTAPMWPASLTRPP
jgi:hypothetical protein